MKARTIAAIIFAVLIAGAAAVVMLVTHCNDLGCT